MRYLLVASLMLVPMASALPARASEPTHHSKAIVHRNQRSTGIKGAVVKFSPASVNIPPHDMASGFTLPAEIDFDLIVGKHGKVHDVRITNSTDPFLNSVAITDVYRIRWQPARLDHHSIKEPVDLRMIIHS